MQLFEKPQNPTSRTSAAAHLVRAVVLAGALAPAACRALADEFTFREPDASTFAASPDPATPSGPELPGGDDAGTDAGMSCPEGEHACGGECLSATSLTSCGPGCEVCVPPADNGIATCDGTSCGVRCDPGYHACDGQCLANDDVNSCGASCTPCPHPDNGEATCVGGSCGVQCDPEFHDCNGECVSSSDPATCGSLCEPCPAPAGGSARCEGGVCVPQCPDGQEVCRTTCIAAGTPCEGTCPEGTHVCGAFCSPNDSTNSCGEACEACAPPLNGQPSCDGVSCGVSCNTGFHQCNGACVSNFDAQSCGTSCTPCPAGPANSVPACTSTAMEVACDFACREGYHRCGNTCADDASTATCGSRCEPCSVPTNGRATCDGTTCGIACNSGFKACCGRSCIPESDTCGSCFIIRDPPILIDPIPVFMPPTN